MKVLAAAISEDDILACVRKEASGRMIIDGIIEKAECCVVHLCGCS